MTGDKQEEGKTGLKWGSICQVALAFIFLGFVCVVVANVFAAIRNSSNTTHILIDVSISLICLLLGGFVVGTSVRYRGALHGMLLGLIAGVVIVIFSIVGMQHDGVSAGWIILTLTVELLFSLGFGALGGFLGMRLRNR